MLYLLFALKKVDYDVSCILRNHIYTYFVVLCYCLCVAIAFIYGMLQISCKSSIGMVFVVGCWCFLLHCYSATFLPFFMMLPTDTCTNKYNNINDIDTRFSFTCIVSKQILSSLKTDTVFLWWIQYNDESHRCYTIVSYTFLNNCTGWRLIHHIKNVIITLKWYLKFAEGETQLKRALLFYLLIFNTCKGHGWIRI